MTTIHMRYFGLVTLFLFCALHLTAVPHAVENNKSSGAIPQRIKLQGTANIPLLLQQPGNRPAVEIMINGQGPYLFLVETGAHIVGISSRLAATLGLPRVKNSSMPEAGYHVDSIALGGAVFEDLNVFDLPPLGNLDIQGVLGLPLFQNVLLTIDYPEHRLRLERGNLPSANGKDILEVTRVEGFWGLPISMAGHDFTAVLDTQNSGSLNVPPDVAALLSLTDLRVVGKARGAFGETEVKRGQLPGDLLIGSCRFPQAQIGVLQLPPEYPNRANVGSGLLKHFVLTLDQVNARLRLKHPGPCVIETPPSPMHAAPAPSGA
jgi:hypothetical protein